MFKMFRGRDVRDSHLADPKVADGNKMIRISSRMFNEYKTEDYWNCCSTYIPPIKPWQPTQWCKWCLNYHTHSSMSLWLRSFTQAIMNCLSAIFLGESLSQYNDIVYCRKGHSFLRSHASLSGPRRIGGDGATRAGRVGYAHSFPFHFNANNAWEVQQRLPPIIASKKKNSRGRRDGQVGSTTAWQLGVVCLEFLLPHAKNMHDRSNEDFKSSIRLNVSANGCLTLCVLPLAAISHFSF